MKKAGYILIIVFLAFSCSLFDKYTETSITDSSLYLPEKDGLSYEEAVVINEHKASRGTSAEYTWLRKNYPGYRILQQTSTYHNNKPYDIITIITRDKDTVDFYFDISAFYGDL
jgi:hypothetical protein